MFLSYLILSYLILSCLVLCEKYLYPYITTYPTHDHHSYAHNGSRFGGVTARAEVWEEGAPELLSLAPTGRERGREGYTAEHGLWTMD